MGKLLLLKTREREKKARKISKLCMYGGRKGGGGKYVYVYVTWKEGRKGEGEG